MFDPGDQQSLVSLDRKKSVTAAFIAVGDGNIKLHRPGSCLHAQWALQAIAGFSECTSLRSKADNAPPHADEAQVCTEQ